MKAWISAEIHKFTSSKNKIIHKLCQQYALKSLNVYFHENLYLNYYFEPTALFEPMWSQKFPILFPALHKMSNNCFPNTNRSI
jgi:hypothetical protein